MVQRRQAKSNPPNQKQIWQQSLEDLKWGLTKIQRKDSFELSFEQLYRMTYDIVREKKFRELYEEVQELVCTHVQTIRTNIYQSLNEDRLDNLLKEWTDHLVSARMFRDVLMFLEQAYILKENLDNVYDMSISVFRNEIIGHGEIRERVQNILLGMIHAERKGEVIDHSIFKATINMLITLTKVEDNNIEYEQIFEKPFLLQSVVFYQQEAQNLLSKVDTITYIRHYETRLNEEKERVNTLLHQQTERSIITVLDKCLIKDHLTKIFELKNGLRYLLQTDCFKELSIIYEWYRKFDQENDFVGMVTQIYYEFGLSHVDKDDVRDADQAEVVKTIIELKEKFNSFQCSCFQNNQTLKENIENNFQIIFNQNPRMTEFLSAYIHEALKKNARDLSEEKFDEQLDTFMELFKILNDKDVFERFYKNHLAKRLLTKPNLEVERKMLTKLKTECGGSFTSNLEAMLKDVEISSVHMDIFNAEIINNNESLGNIDFSITILQSGAWRLLQFPPCKFPPAPSTLFELYTTFYNDKHTGRKLNLQANFGSAMIKANYEKNTNENLGKRTVFFFDVSTLQMIILMLFNDHDCLSIQEIQDKTNIPESNLISSLNPLVFGKPIHRILRRVGNFPPKSPLTLDTVIAVNEKYQSKAPRIKLPFNSTQTDAVSDREVIEQRTNRERAVEIDAAIVRVMKVRKVLAHRNIITEVIQQLKSRFKPDVKFIDTRISELVRKEYIEEKADEPNTYLYIS